MKCKHVLLLKICFLLSGCYYTADLQYQTLGSFVGGIGTGYALAETALMSTGGGIIAGSILGGMIGQELDNKYSPLLNDNPLVTPVHRYYYQMVRPTLEVDNFKSGQIYYNHVHQLPYIALKSPFENSLDTGARVCLPKT